MLAIRYANEWIVEALTPITPALLVISFAATLVWERTVTLEGL
jgi:hypothetical protein